MLTTYSWVALKLSDNSLQPLSVKRLISLHYLSHWRTLLQSLSITGNDGVNIYQNVFAAKFDTI